MRAGRKIGIGFGATLALILLALILAPVLFRDRIEVRAKTAIESAVDAHVDWRSVGLSFFRHFPNLTLTLQDLTVRGTGPFDGDTLAAVPGFRLVLDLRSLLFGDQTVIRSIDVNAPTLHLIVLADGAANWDIVRSDTAATPETEAATFDVGLRALSVTGATVTFDNRQAGLQASIEDLDHSLRGDFTRDRFDIGTSTRAGRVTVRAGGVPWLDGVQLEADVGIDADLANRTFTLGENRIRLNDLALAFTGSVAAGDDGDVTLDVTFESPDNESRSLLSLVPALRQHDFASLETTGRLSVSGRIDGRFGERSFPAFSLLARLDSASFRYPDLPLPARDIFLDLAVENPGGDADSTVVNVRRFQARIGDDPIVATLIVRTPMSDPDVALAMNGTVDLGAAGRTLKLEGIEELAGIVSADVAVHARKSAVLREEYDRIEAHGTVGATGVAFRSAALPQPLTIDALDLRLSPRAAELRSYRGTVGSSDLRIAGTLDNLLGYALGEGDLRGRASLESDHFDLAEWQSEDSLTAVRIPPRLDFVLQAAFAELSRGRLDMTDARGTIRVKDERLTLDSLRMNALGGSLRVSGFYDTTDPEHAAFDVDVAITDAGLAASSEALTTVRSFAPVARYAEGRFSTSMHLTGALRGDLSPILSALSGRGALETSQLVLRDFPPMDRIAAALKSSRLENPALRAISTVIDIRDGRLHVRPFDVGVGGTTLTVGGSNGLDRSLDYDLVLALPQSALEGTMRQAVNDLFARAGAAAAGLDSASVIRVGVKLTGTIDDPSVSLDVGRGVETAAQSLGQAAQATVDQARQTVEARADSARDEARQRAEAEAQQIVDEAEQRAAAIRTEAKQLADTIRSKANQQADSLVARANSPIARLAAQRAADTLRREADERANDVTAEADRRADQVVAEARAKAEALIRSREP